MAKKTAKRVKHMPQRTCVGCRQTLAKRSLIRVVRTPEGLRVDLTGKLPGRGAYLHDQRDCWERGLKGALAYALKIELTDHDRETLQAYMISLPKEEPLPGEEHLLQEGPQKVEDQTSPVEAQPKEELFSKESTPQAPGSSKTGAGRKRSSKLDREENKTGTAL